MRHNRPKASAATSGRCGSEYALAGWPAERPVLDHKADFGPAAGIGPGGWGADISGFRTNDANARSSARWKGRAETPLTNFNGNTKHRQSNAEDFDFLAVFLGDASLRRHSHSMPDRPPSPVDAGDGWRAPAHAATWCRRRVHLGRSCRFCLADFAEPKLPAWPCAGAITPAPRRPAPGYASRPPRRSPHRHRRSARRSP